ncbi:MAG TPA: serine/threonine-protein kinase, partial [Polyangia bacterium]|nr:serine/threonine-protein kinase [Polyangia bacterium]
MAADDTTSLPGAADGEGDGPPPGGTIGRFVVIGLLGRGGMGVVLSAYDPVLDRRVALKLLRPGASSGDRESEGRARLQREAQAMAKLSHPNVVAVHDVGAVAGQLFIAMEFIDGQTLKAWLAGARRGWREIVRMFAAAGRGLQAAHAAGLVHRDFKPDNVLIGHDGRARVGDFGLVSVTRASGGADAREPGATRQGAVLGTPGYLPPEQLRGEASDAQSDQFSFCVALYEALYQQRPFPSDADGYKQAALGGDALAPRKSDVPRWLGDVILRGLRPRREERWPTMSALLVELERDPERTRRRATRVGAVVLALAALAAFARVVQKQRAAVCGDASARLAGVWDAGRRAASERAFVATGLPFAGETFVKVAASLDHYTGEWTAMHEEACRATRVEGRQSDSLLDLRMACLERRRATLSALTDEWSRGVDAEALANAIHAASALPPVDECADARALTERVPAPRDAAALAAIDAARAHLDRARALGDARRLREARAQAEQARAEAEATGFLPVRAEAALLLGRLIHEFAEPGAVAPLQDAARLAEQARDDRLAADAMIELTGAMADGGLAPAAVLLSPVAEALVVRAGDR